MRKLLPVSALCLVFVLVGAGLYILPHGVKTEANTLQSGGIMESKSILQRDITSLKAMDAEFSYVNYSITTDKKVYTTAEFDVYVNVTALTDGPYPDLTTVLTTSADAKITAISVRETQTMSAPDTPIENCTPYDEINITTGKHMTIPNCIVIGYEPGKEYEGDVYVALDSDMREREKTFASTAYKPKNLYICDINKKCKWETVQPPEMSVGETKQYKIHFSVPQGSSGEFTISTPDGSYLDPWWSLGNSYTYEQMIPDASYTDSGGRLTDGIAVNNWDCGDGFHSCHIGFKDPLSGANASANATVVMDLNTSITITEATTTFWAWSGTNGFNMPHNVTIYGSADKSSWTYINTSAAASATADLVNLTTVFASAPSYRYLAFQYLGHYDQWMFIDEIYVFGSYVAPADPITWSNNSTSYPAAYSPATNTTLSVFWNATAGLSTTLIEGNWSGAAVNYTVTGNISTYRDIFGAGTYYWRSYANDTSGKQNKTDIWYFTIAKAANVADLYLKNSTGEYKNMNMEITYGMQTNATGTTFIGTPKLYRNDTYTGAAYENTTLGAGPYAYKVNSTGTANYSDNTTGATYYVQVNQAASGLALTAAPGWTILEGASALISCANTIGASGTMTLDGTVVSSPYNAVLATGTHAVVCIIANTNYTPTSVGNNVVVSAIGTGCTNSTTFAYYTTFTPADANTTLDFTAQWLNGIVRPDMNDFKADNANLTKFYNSTGAYIIAANNTAGLVAVHFGNYYANLNIPTGTVKGTVVNFTVTQESPYVYTFVMNDEMTNIAGRPPSTNNIYYTLFCPGGTNQVSLNDTNSTTQTIAAYSQLSRTELDIRYSATDFYYRDLLLTTPVAARTFYWADATTITLVRTTFTLYDNSGGLFPNASLYIQKQIANGLPSITDGLFDSENKMVGYLVDGQEYQLTITSGTNSRLIGLLYSDSGTTSKTIIIGPSELPSSSNYTYTVAQDNTTKAVTFRWIDPQANTLQSDMWVYNNTNLSELLYHGVSTSQNVEMVYTPTSTAAALKVITKVNNTALDMSPASTTNCFGCDVFTAITNTKTKIETLFGKSAQNVFLSFITGTFLLVIAMTFPGFQAKIGAIVVALIAVLLSMIGLWPGALGLMVILLVFAVLNKMTDKRGENL